MTNFRNERATAEFYGFSWRMTPSLSDMGPRTSRLALNHFSTHYSASPDIMWLLDQMQDARDRIRNQQDTIDVLTADCDRYLESIEELRKLHKVADDQ